MNERPDQRQHPGGLRPVLDAVLRALHAPRPGTLVLVLETEGSTYSKAGAIAYFGADGEQVGWLSGGCLEPEIEKRALQVSASGAYQAMEIDTRDDEDLFSGSSVGCRGRLRLLLLPLQSLPGIGALLEAWRLGRGALTWLMHAEGMCTVAGAGQTLSWPLQPAPVADGQNPVPASGRVIWAAQPVLMMFGAGPETASLIALMQSLDWCVVLVESRPRWQHLLPLADVAFAGAAEGALQQIQVAAIDAVLVMHHHFELDRQALLAVADVDVGYVGLLGPRRRRDDLLKLLPMPVVAQLAPRLQAPVGLHLGGFGFSAIALSIAAQLQARLHVG